RGSEARKTRFDEELKLCHRRAQIGELLLREIVPANLTHLGLPGGQWAEAHSRGDGDHDQAQRAIHPDSDARAQPSWVRPTHMARAHHRVIVARGATQQGTRTLLTEPEGTDRPLGS